MESEYQRKRYWGRSMVGWKGFDRAMPNHGHVALADLEKRGHLGVALKDRPEFYQPEELDNYYMQSTGTCKLAIVTQNVDSLHERGGSKDVIHLHGRGGHLRCMQCGKKHDRNEFHKELELMNHEWLAKAKEGYDESTEMRPDGDAMVNQVDYDEVHVPNCPHCQTGFYKPDVVFFGDTVPKHRVAFCQSAVEAADGILVVGTSLAVHSAFRYVRAAVSKGTSVAILNVGETRAEAEGLDHLLKVEAPAGDTLSLLARKLVVDGGPV
jgi:NAD-dependent deacetylase sirtuin 4